MSHSIELGRISALYVEPMAGAATEDKPNVLIEANIDEGVVSAPLSKYLHCQTRLPQIWGLICQSHAYD
jgi:hypothetical protein